ncbi:LTR retrotransposon, partial [Pseudoloma neurophilia]
MQEQQPNNNKFNYDMASAVKIMPRFSGEDTEDVTVWLRDCALVAVTAMMSEDTTLRAMILALDGKARSWASQATQGKITTRDSFVQLIKGRFSNQCSNNITLTRFLSTSQAASYDDFAKLLKDATLLFERSLLQSTPLIQLVIAKSPTELKAYLLEKGKSSEDWHQFVSMAEESAWIAFPEKLQINSVNRNPQNVNEIRNRLPINSSTFRERNPRRPFKNCEFHGKCGHITDDCFILKKALGILKSKGRGSVNAMEEEENNEKSFIYSNSLAPLKKNPFFLTVKCCGKLHVGLLDTGADTSIIHESNLPPDAKIINSRINVQSASGDRLKIIGQAIDIPLTIGSNKILFSPFVTNSSPEYTIIGTPIIKKYPYLIRNVIEHIANQKSHSDKKRININSVTTIEKFNKLFKHEIDEATMCTVSEHTIETGNADPIAVRNHRIPIHWTEKLDEMIQKMYANKIIRESNSPWRSRIVPIPKKDGSVRLCLDFRPLNRVTVKDQYPIPRIDDIIEALAKAKYFSTLDATSGYFQIPLAEKDKQKTAFSWKNNLYEFNRMPFGLSNAPATFQRIMDKILKKEIGDFVMVYFDDIIVFSGSEQEHKKHLDIVLGKLASASMFLNKNKCNFFKTEIEILGQIISNGIVKPDPKKTEAILKCSEPQTIKELRSFLGLANQIRDFVPAFAKIVAPLNELLKGKSKRSVEKVKWSQAAAVAFKKTKETIAQVTQKAQPDLSLPFILTTDASNSAIG